MLKAMVIFKVGKRSLIYKNNKGTTTFSINIDDFMAFRGSLECLLQSVAMLAEQDVTDGLCIACSGHLAYKFTW
jgi:hypothetical protein